MTFLNTTLLFALVAIGIPIALHLTARREPKQVSFPSIRLLRKRFETNRTKVRVRRWWLLALRILALAAVAFALAGPVINGQTSLVWSTIAIIAAFAVALLALASVAATRGGQKALTLALLIAGGLALLTALGWGALTLASSASPELDASRPVALAIVVDNGPLSSLRDAGEIQLESIRDAAIQLLMAVHPESRLSFIDRSGTPATFALDRSGALSKAETFESLESAQSLPARIDAALRLLGSSDLESKQLVVIGSLYESSLPPDTLEELFTRGNEAGVRTTLWRIEAPVTANRSLSTPLLSDPSPAPNSPVTVSAMLSITGEDRTTTSASRVTAECVLFPAKPSLPVVRDGKIIRPEPKAVDRLSVEVRPGQDVDLKMTLPPLPTGIHHGAIQLIGADALAVDDVAYFTVVVRPPSQLLIVGNDLEELDVLGFAITAPAPLDDPAAQYEVARITYTDLGASNLDSFDGVILIDPPADVLEQNATTRYVDNGGSVLVSLGPSLGNDALQWNGAVFERRWRVPTPGSFFEISSASHPAVASLAATPGGVPFQDFRISQYWKTKADEAQVLMRYAGTGHIALMELTRQTNEASQSDSNDTLRPVGSKLLVLTTPIPQLATRSAWNELFSGSEAWPAFLLVRDLARYLSGRATERFTLPIGGIATLPKKSGTDEENPSAEVKDSGPGTRKRWQWFPPVGDSPIPIDLEEDTSANSRVMIGRVENSGVHWVRGGQLGLGFTANLQRSALDQTPIDPVILERWSEASDVRQINSVNEMEWTGTEETPSVSIWSPVMLIAMIAFLLEQILSNRFYRQGAASPSKSSRVAA
ncbi:MAG: BatA domain-containing protein [Planctomycetota bacterium]